MKREFKYIDLPFIDKEVYRVYSSGKIWSEKTNHYMKFCQKTKDGYVTLCIWGTDGKCHRLSRHRLLALAYIPRTAADIKHHRNCVHFKDFNRKNKELNNLQWVSRAELAMKTEIRNNPDKYVFVTDYSTFIDSLIAKDYDMTEIIDVLSLKNSRWTRDYIKARIKLF